MDLIVARKSEGIRAMKSVLDGEAVIAEDARNGSHISSTGS